MSLYNHMDTLVPALDWIEGLCLLSKGADLPFCFGSLEYKTISYAFVVLGDSCHTKCLEGYGLTHFGIHDLPLHKTIEELIGRELISF